MNAWAAAGFKFDQPEGLEAARALAAARAAEATAPPLPTLIALQLQAYALEVQEATGVYGRRRARRRLARRCLSGTAALLCSMLTLLGAGFLIWGDAVEARRLSPLPLLNACPLHGSTTFAMCHCAPVTATIAPPPFSVARLTIPVSIPARLTHAGVPHMGQDRVGVGASLLRRRRLACLLLEALRADLDA